MPFRQKCELLGYDLGTYEDWDVDGAQQWFSAWVPGKDVKVSVPNARGEMLVLTIDLESGEVHVDAHGDDSDDEPEVVGKWSWRDFVGHAGDVPLSHGCEPSREDA